MQTTTLKNKILFKFLNVKFKGIELRVISNHRVKTIEIYDRKKKYRAKGYSIESRRYLPSMPYEYNFRKENTQIDVNVGFIRIKRNGETGYISYDGKAENLHLFKNV